MTEDQKALAVDIDQWLREREENCLRLMQTKTGEDRAGWQDDADYFKGAGGCGAISFWISGWAMD